MGAHPYWYFVKYQSDLNDALQALREFEAGRYGQAALWVDFPPDENSPSNGPRHSSLEEALESCDEEGTRSIIDLVKVSDSPNFCVAQRLDDATLEGYFKTSRPSRQMIEDHQGLFEDIERGQGICIVIYKDDLPDEIFFAGYSFD